MMTPSSPDKTPVTVPTTLKVHLPNGGFNIVKFGDAIDVKVRLNTLVSFESIDKAHFITNLNQYYAR